VIWRGPGDAEPFTTNELLEGQRAVGCTPKVVATNTAAEYWRGDAWLAHGDGTTGTDVDDAPGVRHYLLAGVDHLGEFGALAAPMIPAVNPPNGLSAVGPIRAIVVALEAWVRGGTEPPSSRVPRVDDGTATDRNDALAFFAGRYDVHTPTQDALPVGTGPAARTIVSALDPDGNEIAGVRLPQLVEPVATYTGWNVRPPLEGLPGLMPDFLGSRLPFESRCIEDRYADRTDYEARVRTAAEQLVVQRCLLAEDVDLVVDAALAAYDESLSGA
jgi:Alpha/beta hydrolase domain